jgi:Family of unknown function (DUF6900)
MQRHTHEDYAEAAESAQRGSAWPQAVELWRLAARYCSVGDRVEYYQRQIARCEGEVAVDQQMADIARRVLRIPTLDERKSDWLDFHEVGVWQLKEALRLAYRVGRDAK